MRPCSTLKSKPSRQRAGASSTRRSRSAFACALILIRPVHSSHGRTLLIMPSSITVRPGGLEEGRPLPLGQRAHVRRIASLLDVEDEGRKLRFLVPQDVLHEERAAG